MTQEILKKMKGKSYLISSIFALMKEYAIIEEYKNKNITDYITINPNNQRKINYTFMNEKNEIKVEAKINFKMLYETVTYILTDMSFSPHDLYDLLESCNDIYSDLSEQIHSLKYINDEDKNFIKLP